MGSNSKIEKSKLMKSIFKFILFINLFFYSSIILSAASEYYHKNKLEKFFIDLKNSKNLNEAHCCREKYLEFVELTS